MNSVSLFREQQVGYDPESAISSMVRLLLLLLFSAAMITGCGKPAEVKSPEAKSQEPVAAEAKHTSTNAADVAPSGFANPHILSLGKPGVDRVGPAGVPDGEPDLVIQVDLDSHLLQQIAAWEIDANDSRGHWVSSEDNPQHYWVIKAEVDPKSQPSGDSSRILLCFADNHDPNISALTLTAMQSNGAILFRYTISK
jgi:hypothetical protein